MTAPARETPPDELRRLDQAWASGDAALVSSVTATPLAARLREMGQVQPALKLLQVVDARGRLLATTVRGGRLWNGDTQWFRALGENAIGGRPYVCDIVTPPGGSAMFEVDYPIRDPAEGQLLGAVRALYDVSDLYSVIASVRVGRTGHTVLMRGADGLILAADASSSILKDRYPGFEFIQAARREHRASWAMPRVRAGEIDEPPRVVGFAPVEQVPNVDWTVAVEQDLEEAVAPIKSISWYLVIHFVGVIGTVVLLTLYFSSKLEAPVIEEASLAPAQDFAYGRHAVTADRLAQLWSARHTQRTITIVRPARLSRRKISITSALDALSRFPVGSSASTIAGSVTIARAMATRCC